MGCVAYASEGTQECLVCACAVISFEKRLFPSSNMWGKVEQCNVVLGLAHKSYKLSSCLSVLV